MIDTVGKMARQVSCDSAEFSAHVGRRARVIDTVLDENLIEHTLTDDGVWCPTRHLVITAE